MPFLKHNPLIAQPASLVRAALLGLTLCLLLPAAAPSTRAQASDAATATGSTHEPVVTKYQAITRQSGNTSPTRLLQGIGLFLTVCLGLLFVRAVRNEALAARQAELEGWATPDQLSETDDDDDDAELVGERHLQPDEERVDDQASAQETPGFDTEPVAEPPADSMSAPSGTSPARLIYHVGSYRFSADRQVVGSTTHNHLEDLCNALCSPDNTRRVVRIASGLSSRYAKSQVAAELAQMLAERADARVLALEGDLDAPALHRVMHVNVPRGYGLTEQLQRMAELDLIDTASAMQLSPNLHAMVESRWSTPAALALPQFSQLLARQRDVYDFIIVDGPVVDTWPDADHFGRLIDGVVFVTLASTRLPDTLTLLGQHFAHDLLLRIVKTGEPSGS